MTSSRGRGAPHRLQIKMGIGGPWLQAPVLTTRSWLTDLRPGEVLSKLDLRNAYGSAD